MDAGLGDDEAGRAAGGGQGLGGGLFDEGRMVVVGAEVAEDEGDGGGVERFADVVAGDVVGQMAVAAHDALLDGPGVRADFEHFEVVIGLEQEEVGAAEMIANGFGEVAEVGGDADAEAFGAEAEADGVGGVVGDGEGGDGDVADGEGLAGLEGFELRGEVAPGDAGRGEAGQVDGDAEEASESDEAADVVGVFVGDEDGVERGGVFADGGEAVEDFAAAKAGVDEQAGAAGGEEGRVAGTGAGKYAELDDAEPPGSLCRGGGGEVKGWGGVALGRAGRAPELSAVKTSQAPSSLVCRFDSLVGSLTSGVTASAAGDPPVWPAFHARVTSDGSMYFEFPDCGVRRVAPLAGENTARFVLSATRLLG